MPADENLNLDDPERAGLETALALLSELASAFSSSPVFSASHLSSGEKVAEPPDVAARYRTLVEQIPAVIFMAFLDQGLSEAYVSPHVETILGFTQEQWLNDPVRWYNQIHPDDRTRWSIEAADLIISGKPVRSVYRVIARDGHIVWFHCEVKVVRTEDDRPWFLHGAAFDISDLKKAEIALQHAHDQLDARVQERTTELARTVAELKRSNADLEQFAYSASHDLQEPLRVVSIYTQMLQRKLGQSLGSAGEEYLRHIGTAVTRLEQLLKDLRAFVQASTMGQDSAQDVDAGEALARALANLTPAIESSGASITHGPIPWVHIHEFQLEQLFQNLIGNAIRYRSPDAPQIQVAAEKYGEEWKFSIRDNGIGIDPRYQEQIFGMFKRLHSSADYPGTGMGLAICKRIVERTGGRIGVESQLGQGSTFWFTVPAALTH
jgi:PAS domain S-box-containing protein